MIPASQLFSLEQTERASERASGGEFLSRGRGTREMSYMITSCVTPPQQHTALSQTSQTCAALNGLHQMFGYHNHTKLHTPLDWLIFAHMNKSAQSLCPCLMLDDRRVLYNVCWLTICSDVFEGNCFFVCPFH